MVNDATIDHKISSYTDRSAGVDPSGMDASIDDSQAIEEAAFARIVPTHEAREGVEAFLEKRRPTFLGR